MGSECSECSTFYLFIHLIASMKALTLQIEMEFQRVFTVAHTKRAFPCPF